MTWKNIRLILLREVRDQLRDRRTLFLVLVLPLILYPGLAIGMLQMAMYLNEHPQVAVILGTENLPELPLIEEGRIAERWFYNPETAQKLLVVTDSPTIQDSVDLRLPGTSHLKKDELLNAARRVEQLAQTYRQLTEQLAPYDAKIADEAFWLASATNQQVKKTDIPADLDFKGLVEKRHQVHEQLVDEFANSKLQVLASIPAGYGQAIAQIDELLASKDFSNSKLRELPTLRPLVVRNRASDKSEVAYRRVRESFDFWEKGLLFHRLEAANLPMTVADPLNIVPLDIAGEQEVAANVWSKVFPAILVIMALTGAFYPAIDVAAGEKERGTMETLLICPATRSEIVLGKFLTVLLFSVATTVLNLISMGATSRYIVSVTQSAAQTSFGNMPLPTAMAICWMVVLLIPLAGLFSALSFALATFARSNKEGQYYLTPLFMVALGLTMFAMSPSIELSTTAGQSLFYCMMPIVGPALLLKALLVNTNGTGVLVFAFPVLMSSVGYTLLALWWAVEQFKSEDVLFRESERFDLGLWLNHLFRDKEPTPTTSEAVACFIIMMLLQFLSINAFGQSMVGVKPEDMGMKVIQLAVIQQIALIASPAIFMALLLTKSARQTLKLNWPKFSFLAAAIALPLALHPLANELLHALHQFFPQLPDAAKAAFATMADQSLPLAVVIGAFALTPAICEEVAFRGFILSGLSRGGRTGIAILLSSITFGIIHMIPQQVFNATLIGLVLGLIAVRSNSLLPGVLFHLCFNSMAVLHAQLSGHLLGQPESELGPARWFVSVTPEGIRYMPITLGVCAVSAFALIRWLIRQPHVKLPTSAAAEIGAPREMDDHQHAALTS